MPLSLPKPANLNPSFAYAVGKQLTTIVAGQPSARTTYEFYEEIDAWLGPFGDEGYPLGYGKKYNRAFATDPILNSPHFPVARRWVQHTTRHLQLALIDEIVAAILKGQLSRLQDEGQLRDAAFTSHPKAYLNGGLLEVARFEPGCLLIIVMIPYAQFNPANPNFIRTFNQVVALLKEPSLRDWFGTALTGIRHLPYSAFKVAVEQSMLQERPASALPMLIGSTVLLGLRNRYDPLGLFFY